MSASTQRSGDSEIDPGKRLARLTAVIYALYFVVGIPFMLRSSLIVPADAAATAAKIIASEALYRMTIVAELASDVLYLGLAYLFYLLLRSVSRPWALLGTLVTIAGCIVLIVATSVLSAPLTLLTGNFFHAISVPERQELALVALKTYSQAYIIALLLFGVQWLIMGPLFTVSGLVPRPIGYWLTAAGVGWVVFAVANLIAPPLGVALRPIAIAIGASAEVALPIALWVRAGSSPSRSRPMPS